MPYIRSLTKCWQIASHGLQTEDIYHTLAQSVYPFNLPFNIFLDEIIIWTRCCRRLWHKCTAYSPQHRYGKAKPNIAIAREQLGLSFRQYKLVITHIG